MIIKIVAAGSNLFTKLYRRSPEEMLIGVDGGIHDIVKKGLIVDLGIGDFDSCNIEDVVNCCSKVKVYPKEKDYSDLELAIREVVSIPHEKIIIYNATGGRLDHFYANLNILIKYSKYNLEIVDTANLIRIIDRPSKLEKTPYQYLSFFALEEGTIITLKGFKYELNGYHLEPMDNLCLSNELIGEGFLDVNNKKLLVIESNNPENK